MLKKSLILLVLVSFLNTILLAGCGEEKPVSSVQTQESDTEFSKLEARAQLYENWIAEMDPFVTTNSDGTYSLDWDSFINYIRSTNPKVAIYFTAAGVASEDAKVIEELKNGIPIANLEILQFNAKRSSDAMQPEAAGQACWWYWWGKRCCYWGSTGWTIVNALQFGAAGGAIILPLIGFVTAGMAWLFQQYMINYNGFCLNQSYIGGQWVTRP